MNLFSDELTELLAKARRGLEFFLRNNNHATPEFNAELIIDEIKLAVNDSLVKLEDKAIERMSHLVSKLSDLNIELREPIGAICEIKFLDDGSEGSGFYVSFLGVSEDDENEDEAGVNIDEIFYHTNGEEGLKSLMEEGSESFVVLDYKLQYENPANRFKSKPRI